MSGTAGPWRGGRGRNHQAFHVWQGLHHVQWPFMLVCFLTLASQLHTAGTGPEVFGNTNAPPAVTYSAIIYSMRCMVPQEIPLNQGCLAPLTVRIPPHCLLSPSSEAAVVGGNVLTSQRVTDVVLKCFKAAAASQVILTLQFLLYQSCFLCQPCFLQACSC